jgi:hypothetical protein
MGIIVVRIARLAFAALAIVVLIVGGLFNPQSRGWAYLRGAVTLFMVITGIVYAALLANAEVGLTTAWIGLPRSPHPAYSGDTEPTQV